MISYILAAVTGVIVLIADQFTKYLVSTNLEISKSYDILPKFLDKIIGITYIHNTGGAWGMLGGYTWLLLSVTIVVMLVCIALLLKCGVRDKLMFWSIMLVLSGGLGNMIDRIFRDGNVIDFLEFKFIRFPVFNIADCAIVVGAGLLLLYFFKDMIDENKKKRLTAEQITSEDKTNGKD